jgi:hypothetical protein
VTLSGLHLMMVVDDSTPSPFIRNTRSALLGKARVGSSRKKLSRLQNGRFASKQEQEVRAWS